MTPDLAVGVGAAEFEGQHAAALAFGKRLRKTLRIAIAVACVLFVGLQAASMWMSSTISAYNQGASAFIDRAGYQRTLILNINQGIFDAMRGDIAPQLLVDLQSRVDADRVWLVSELERWSNDAKTSQAWREATQQVHALRDTHTKLLTSITEKLAITSDVELKQSARSLQRQTSDFVDAQNRAIQALAVDIERENSRLVALANVLGLLSMASVIFGMLLAARVITQRLTQDHQTLVDKSASLDRMAMLIERTDSMFVITDAQSRITYVNRPFEKVSGYTLDELRGKVPGHVLQCEETNPKARAAIGAAVREGRSTRATVINKSKSGRLYWVRLQIEPIRDRVSGEVVGFTSLEQDVTHERTRREELAVVLDAMPAGVLVVDETGVVIEANPLTTAWTGVRVGENLLQKRQVGEGMYLMPDGKVIPADELPITRVLRDPSNTKSRHIIFQNCDGFIRHLKFAFQFAQVALIKGKRLIVTITDVTGLVQTERVLQLAAQSANIGSWEADFSQRSCVMSALWWHRLGQPAREGATSLRELLRTIAPEHRRQTLQTLSDMQSHPNIPGRLEVKLNHADGRTQWILVTGTVTTISPSGSARSAIGIHQDITQRKITEEGLRRESTIDSLTDMPNRRSFARTLEEHIATCTLGETIVPFALLFLDLDHFKDVNDRLGHNCGDDVLRIISTRIEESIRTGDVIAARLGGDEFVVLATRLATFNDADIIAEKLQQAIARPMRVADRDLEMTCSIGIATPLESGYDAHALLRDADIALYAAKEAGRNNFKRFETLMRERVEADHALAADLRRAIVGKEFINHYQPIVDAETGQLVNMEALVRWAHPSRGLTYPSYFIEMAEATGLIAMIGMEVLDSACADYCELVRELGEDAPPCVSVNLSRAQLVDNLPIVVAEALRKWGLSPSCLQLEITETLAMLHSDSINILHRIRQMGVRLALDDFGTGYSSLSTLDTLPITSIKVDKSFVDSVETNAYRQSIVAATIKVARALSISTVAEGVETDAQRRALVEMGCNQLQGYLFSKPVGLRQLITWHKANCVEKQSAPAHH